MADVLLGLLGPLIELGNCFVKPIKRQLNYLCCFNKNVKSFKDEAKKLANAETNLEYKVTLEKNNGKEIVSDVTDWLEDYSNMETKVGEIEANISNIQSGCLVIKSRYVLSKEVKKVTKHMKQLWDGCKFDGISRSLPPPSMAPAPLGEANEFPSRKQIEEDVMQALRGKNVHRMGICGMGGIGKTTMAKKVMHGVRDEQLFDEVLMVVVSKDIDKLDIQQQLAELLGLSLGVETLQARAHKLRARLTGNHRILIVLDDIWDSFELADLGVPCESGDTSCTFLFTSRNHDVLKQMSGMVFTMEVLSKEEAWSLFKSKVGDFVEDKHLKSIAKQVADECYGLPLGLAILGSSLKDKKDIRIWKDTLCQLKGSYLETIPNFLRTIYPSLRRSYDSLDDSNGKRLLLLCSQFLEDSNISFDDLTMYSLSLRLFGRTNNVDGTRDRVSAIVDQLKSRSLLLDGRDMNNVRMHDVVRDVATVIAREEGWVDDGQGYNSAVKCEWIFMFPNTHDEDLHDHLVGSSYPSLHLLAIRKRDQWGEPLIIENFPPSFDEMKELCSLSLDYTSIKSLPHAIKYMKNLKMLRLVKCNLKFISIVGELLGLEILVCRECEKIKELPLEIRGLKQLKLLEFQECRNLKKIAPGVISNLTELEEFIMWNSFTDWESTRAKAKEDEETSNASLKELEFLTKLKCLWIQIGDVGLVEQKIRLPESIKKYKIAVGRAPSWRNYSFGNSLSLRGLPQHIICQNWIQNLVSTTKDLYLGEGSTNLDMVLQGSNIMFLTIEDNEMVEELRHTTTTLADSRTSDGVFPVLKSMELNNLPNLKKIYDESVPEGSISFKNLENLHLYRLPMLTSLWKIPHQNASSLNNLCTISIWDCNNLKNLFCVERAQDAFLQLRSLSISECEMMEEVFYSDDNENEDEGVHSFYNIFPKLEELYLGCMPSLTAFAKGSESIEFPLLSSLSIMGCPKLTVDYNNDFASLFFDYQKVAFGGLKKLGISGHVFSKIWCSQISHASFGQLEELTIHDSEIIVRSLHSFSIIQHFLNLKSLKISHCTTMEKVIANEVFFKSFPALESLDLSHLPKLEEICDTTVSVGSNALLNLKRLKLVSLPALKHLWNGSNPWILLNNLRDIDIFSCRNLQNLFSWKMPKNQCLLLRDLQIKYCYMMKYLFSNKENGKKGNSSHITFSNLKHFELKSLTSLVRMFDGVESIDFPELEGIDINYCPTLVSILPSTNGDGDHSSHFIGCAKVASFHSLEWLRIRGCDNIINLWCHQILPGFFGKLKELTINDCGGIQILFSSKIAENLVNLEELSIKYCTQMEKVIGDVEVHGNYRLFPSLVELKFGGLPSLTMFCEWDCRIVLPLLRYISISNCPMMEVLTPKSLSAPNLECIIMDGIEYQEWNEIEDLNGLIRQHITSTTMESTVNEIQEEEEEEEDDDDNDND